MKAQQNSGCAIMSCSRHIDLLHKAWLQKAPAGNLPFSFSSHIYSFCSAILSPIKFLTGCMHYSTGFFFTPISSKKKKLYIYVYFFNQDKGRNCRFICRYCNSRCLQLFRIPKYYNPHLHGSSPWVWEILNLLYFMMAHSESAKAIERSP